MADKFDCPLRTKGCGGWSLIKLPYPEQLKQKQLQVTELLGSFGPIHPIIGMDNPWHYRNKAISSFAVQNHQLISGIYMQGTHRVIPVTQCLLHQPALDKAIEAVRRAARACHYEVFNEDRRTGLLRHILARYSRANDEILVTLVTAKAALPGSKFFVKELRTQCPQISTVIQNINPRYSSAVLGPNEKILFGKGFIEDRLCQLKFRISASSFYQINPEQTEKLYRTAISMAKLDGHQTVLDAYCGIGTIGLIAAQNAFKLIGVESNPQAVSCAIQNARNNHIKNAHFYCEDATAFLQKMTLKRQHVDILFLDPPRAGSTTEFLDSICRISPQKVIYISCNPQTQQRDLHFLCHRGWKVIEIQPVDLFPHTEHIETIALLQPTI